MRQEILSRLVAAGAGGLSGQELATWLGLSRTAVWKHIAALREEGYRIEAEPGSGYRLVNGDDLLIPANLERQRLPRRFGAQYHYHPSLDSTNLAARRLAMANAPEGTVVAADQQLAGRGRLGRHWVSAAGLGLWFSVIVRPSVPPHQLALVTLLTAVAAAEGIEEVAGTIVGIKWPNDLVIGGRKTAGILTEAGTELDRVDYIVIGIGINVLHRPEDFPPELRATATSLAQAGGNVPTRPALLAAILRWLDHDYQGWLGGDLTWLERWRCRSVTLGRTVTVKESGSQYRALAIDVDSDGALIVQTGDGGRRRVVAGEVSLGGYRGDSA